MSYYDSDYEEPLLELEIDVPELENHENTENLNLQNLNLQNSKLCCRKISQKKLARLNLTIGIIWDALFIAFLVWLSATYLDPDQYECQVFMIVSFSIKSLQLLFGLIAVFESSFHNQVSDPGNNKSWRFYLPYLVSQTIACLILTVSIIAVGVLWNKIEQYAQAMTQGSVDEIMVDMSLCIFVLLIWKICNWCSLYTVSEYCHSLRRGGSDSGVSDEVSSETDELNR